MKVLQKDQNEKNKVPFLTIEAGECFLYEGELWLTIAGGSEANHAVVLATGMWQFFTDNTAIEPVQAEVRWWKA